MRGGGGGGGGDDDNNSNDDDDDDSNSVPDVSKRRNRSDSCPDVSITTFFELFLLVLLDSAFCLTLV